MVQYRACTNPCHLTVHRRSRTCEHTNNQTCVFNRCVSRLQLMHACFGVKIRTKKRSKKPRSLEQRRVVECRCISGSGSVGFRGSACLCYKPARESECSRGAKAQRHLVELLEDSLDDRQLHHLSDRTASLKS